MIQFDEYFSDGLKPPTRLLFGKDKGERMQFDEHIFQMGGSSTNYFVGIVCI